MSLQSTYNSVKGVIADNLVSMGVDANSSDGLTTLAGKILDIEPSIGGLDLDTAISLTTPTSAVVGGSVTLTSKLIATYDDETIVDVDLSGVLQNATVKFYDGTTLIGTSTTGLDGVVTINHSYSTVGTHSLKAVFEGTENYDDCTSSIVQVTVTVVDSVDLVTDKSILSYANSDTATLTATVYDDSSPALPLEGVTVSFYNGSEFIGSGITDSNGEATETLYSHGDGDISVTAECGNVSDSLTIEDCMYYNSAEKTYGGTNNHQLYDSNLSVALSTNAEISFDVKTGTTSPSKDYRYWLMPKSLFSGMSYPSCGLYADKKPSYFKFGRMLNGVQSTDSADYSITYNTYVRLKYVKEGTTIKRYADGVLLSTETFGCIDNYSDWTVSIMTWSGSETRYIKNVKFKPL